MDPSPVPVSSTFEVAVPPARVFAYLSDPRHFIAANHDGPIIDQSGGALGVGSWYLLAFDQLRARVVYTAFEPDRTIGVAVVMTGRGSGAMSSTQAFVLSELDGGKRTRIQATAGGHGGLLRWGPFVRAAQSATWRRLRHQLEASA